MKVTVDEGKTEAIIKYPCLMVSDQGKIVLMARAGSGTVIQDKSLLREVGEASYTWAMDCFKPFDGSVTIEND